jgi:hypothetical protein
MYGKYLDTAVAKTPARSVVVLHALILMLILSFDRPAWLDLVVNPSSHNDQALMGEATGFSVMLPLTNGIFLDAIKFKAVEVVVLLVREDRPALEVVNAHASHDVPQDPGFKGGETVVCTKDQLCPCYSMFLRTSPWTAPEPLVIQSRVLCQQFEIHARRRIVMPK